MIPLVWKMKIFWPPPKKYTILNHFKGNFSTPLKKNVQFFHPPQAGIQKILTPLTCRPPPYCWVKNDLPLKSKDIWLSSWLRYFQPAFLDSKIIFSGSADVFRLAHICLLVKLMDSSGMVVTTIRHKRYSHKKDYVRFFKSIRFVELY